MTPERGPVFLARRTYRRRRLADAARLLPIVGTVLICIPLLWQGEGASGATRTTTAMFYTFGLWLFLTLIAGVISRHLRAVENKEPPRGAGD